MKRLLLLLAICAVAYLATGVYVVGPDEQAVVQRFGAVWGPPRPPGAHWGLPWGLDRVSRIKPREVKRVALGPVRVGEDPVGANPLEFLTGDRNLVNVRASIQYTIQDPTRYLFRSTSPDQALQTAGEAALSEILSSQTVDWVLTSGQREIGIVLDDKLQGISDRYQLGIAVRSVDLSSLAPPPDVADAFAKVISALREREQSVHQAESFANKTLAQAAADAQQRVDRGRADCDRAIRQALAEADRFESLVTQYNRAPHLTASRLYLETMAEILPRFRSKMIVDSGTDLDLSILRKEPP